jgi:hypothetical protein
MTPRWGFLAFFSLGDKLAALESLQLELISVTIRANQRIPVYDAGINLGSGPTVTKPTKCKSLYSGTSKTRSVMMMMVMMVMMMMMMRMMRMMRIIIIVMVMTMMQAEPVHGNEPHHGRGGRDRRQRPGRHWHHRLLLH